MKKPYEFLQDSHDFVFNEIVKQNQNSDVEDTEHTTLISDGADDYIIADEYENNNN